jgi:hypothetical protein
MIPSVGPEADRELSEGAISYVRGEELRVIALAHHRRRPSYWSGRK